MNASDFLAAVVKSLHIHNILCGHNINKTYEQRFSSCLDDKYNRATESNKQREGCSKGRRDLLYRGPL